MSSRSIADWRILIHQVTIRIVLDHIPGGIVPIVKDLGSKDMPPDTPD